jgi:branched-chain amino acid transport system substrate-binding protein
MRLTGIDVLLLAADRTGAELALQELRTLGLRWPVIGGDALAGIETAGSLADGMWISSAYLPDRVGEKNAAFVSDYSRAHPGERPDHRGASAYDIVNLIAQAITAVGPRRTAVRDYIARVGRGIPAFDGVTGKIAFDEAGDVPAKSVVVAVVRDGRLVAEQGE